MTPDAKNAQQGFSDCAPVATSHDEREQVSKALSRLCKMAAAVMDADRATLWLWQAGVTRKIASHGCDIPFRSLNWDFDAVDYQPDQRVVIAHALKDVEREAQVTTGSERPVAFLCRVPVAVAPNYVASLIIFAETPRASPPPGELHIVNEIAALMKCEFDRIKQVLLERPNSGKVPALERQLFEKVMSSSNRVFLLDAKLVIRAVSDNAASILGDTPGSLVGRPYLDWESVLGISVAYFLKHSLMQGTCTSDLEVDFPARNGIPGAWTLRATPVTPSDTEERYLYVSIQALFDSIPAPPTGRPLCRSSYDAGSIPLLQPTADLLFSTLVQRRSIRARDGVNYLSIRSWRQPIREFQIAALKALKNNPGAEFPNRIAEEFAGEIKSLLGMTTFNVVVPISCGHSKGAKCLSVEIARALGKQLNIPVVQAFARQSLPGSSHPKQNLKRPPLQLKSPVRGNVLLVDDVASSGEHLVEAANLLRPHCGTVFPVAWIGGDAADDGSHD